ncbi:adenosylcobinamide-GDP ribazoletransferase [Vibrio sp. Isolate23]|uniref:adenosylcobinamide-GDP ribazoletransferase n=1 Tax=Vibrio sp. Isolate23 TaxID=2908533 RepID=UPI001EFD657B|nr:adenosylcobinamide-GDP ribazoletransferase [Vibrio sp. Isolate23]MCG9682456.1 adenosylcobinamide-GDP ribazoletransferase [Vibrio sp. Isolate23]
MMHSLRYQIELFWLALGFFSRLPIPQATPYSEKRMNQAGRYFALVGLCLGALCAMVYWLAESVWGVNVAVVVVMVFSLLLTGAFHEDGLTDMADGIGGGMTLERRLTIMKDSRIGTYGASALVMALLGKYVLLTELAPKTELIVVLLISYTLSRAIAASLIYNMPYVSDPEVSKSKPLANQQSKSELVILAVTALLPMLWLDYTLVVLLITAALMFRVLFKHWLMKRIGGFTGDCLGAAQQLMEIVIYLVILGFL